MRLETVNLASLDELGSEPTLVPEVYERRVAALRRRLEEHGLDAALVYADREHYANSAYLTGFDPRFEEAIVVVARSGLPSVITGMECQALIPEAGYPELRAQLCQAFGLPSQDRSGQRLLRDALAASGLTADMRIGVAGWKPIPAADSPSSEPSLAVPQFVLSEIGAFFTSPVADVTALLMGSEGLRATNEADQIAVFEHRAARASQHVWRALEALAPGRSEHDLVRAMQLDGAALSAHVMCSSGADGVVGLRSPTDRVIETGDALSTAVGLWGGLCARAGRVVSADAPEADELVARIAGPFAEALHRWYASACVGADPGEIVRIVEQVLAPTGVRLLLNAGHLVHLDEWLDSPFVADAPTTLRSGMAIQVDMIPVLDGHPLMVAGAEDAIALADENLRAELAERYPAMWSRMQARRRFMTEVVGLDLSPDVLPLSERQGAFAPALLSPTTVLCA